MRTPTPAQQIAHYHALLHQQHYQAAITTLLAVAYPLLHVGSTQDVLDLLHALPPDERANHPQILVLAGDAWRLRNDWQQAGAHYAQALAVAEERLSTVDRGLALCRQALLCWQRGDVDGAVLRQHRKPWAWALLADHRDAQPAVRVQIKSILKQAEAYPLPHLDLRCLGTFVVRHDTLALPAERWTSIHAQLVLVYLALRGPATRDELIDLLWPDDPVGKAGARLRTTIRLLRKTLNPPWHPHADYVVYQHEQYGIDPRVLVASDVQRFQHWARIARQGEGAARHHACRQALACYNGAFFSGSYNDWVVARREHLQADWLWIGEKYAGGLLLHRKWDEAEAHARQVIGSDGFRERAWHVLLRSLHGQGRRADVIRTYRTMVERFDHELGIAPDAETQQLIAALQ